MFEFIYKYQGTIERHLAAPLVEQRIRYLAHCKEQGMAEGTLQLTAQMMLVVIEELHLKGECRLGRRNIVDAANRWANREPRHYNVKHARKAKSHFISVATQWFQFLGWLRARRTHSALSVGS
jgi:integrase/recombinase XerD